MYILVQYSFQTAADDDDKREEEENQKRYITQGNSSQEQEKTVTDAKENTTSSVLPPKQPHYALLFSLLLQIYAISDIFHNNISLLGSGYHPGRGECILLLPDAHCTRSTSQHSHALRARMAMYLGRCRLRVIRCTTKFGVRR
jgi:hypothetical protein